MAIELRANPQALEPTGHEDQQGEISLIHRFVLTDLRGCSRGNPLEAPKRRHLFDVEESPLGRVNLISDPRLPWQVSGWTDPGHANLVHLGVEEWDVKFHYRGNAASFQHQITFTRDNWLASACPPFGPQKILTWWGTERGHIALELSYVASYHHRFPPENSLQALASPFPTPFYEMRYAPRRTAL